MNRDPAQCTSRDCAGDPGLLVRMLSGGLFLLKPSSLAPEGLVRHLRTIHDPCPECRRRTLSSQG